MTGDDGKGYMYIDTAAKIESSDIDTSKLDTSSDSPSCAESHNRASEKLRDGMHCNKVNADSIKERGGVTEIQQQQVK